MNLQPKSFGKYRISELYKRRVFHPRVVAGKPPADGEIKTKPQSTKLCESNLRLRSLRVVSNRLLIVFDTPLCLPLSVRMSDGTLRQPSPCEPLSAVLSSQPAHCATISPAKHQFSFNDNKCKHNTLALYIIIHNLKWGSLYAAPQNSSYNIYRN